MLQVSEVTKREALLAFQNGLNPWVRQEVEQRGVQKLSEAMTVVESVVKLSLGKEKLGYSKSEERDNSGNAKPRVGKKKPKRKRDKLKRFLCDGPHMLKKCLKKSVLKEKPVGKALVAEVSEKICCRGERRSRQGAQEALVRAKENCRTIQSKPESKERQRLSLMSYQRGFHSRKR
ncbi:hypothetical protein Gotur_006374 [Gossypium turneri]